MDKLRAYIFSDKNLTMLEDITTSKIYKNTGNVIEKTDSYFQQQLIFITTTIVKQELVYVKTFDTNAALKINNIIITECVNFFTNLINNQEAEQEQEQFSSSIEQLNFDDDVEVEVVKQEVKTKPVEQKQDIFKEEIFIFDKELTVAKIKNVMSAELVSCYFDFSDYIVTENNNCFCVDNQEILVPIGNYTPNDLIDKINGIVGEGLVFNIDAHTDIVCVAQPSQPKNKSLTGSLKDALNQKSVNLDFGVKNSINTLLGFEPKTYTIKDKSVMVNIKHDIKHPGSVKIDIVYHEDKTDSFDIPTNVEYNQTKHFTPTHKKRIDFENKEVDDVKIVMKFNTRGRPYQFKIKFTTLSMKSS